MKHTLWFTLLICPLAFGGSCPSGQTKEESALVRLEQSGAQALERHDSDAVGCILAEEFHFTPGFGSRTSPCSTRDAGSR